jgi:hypothetical protein
MKMDTSFPRDKKTIHKNFSARSLLMSLGIGLIVVSVVVLGLSLWEAFGKGGQISLVKIPGFHELTLEEPGLYAGVYQHRGQGPIPAQQLSQLDVKILSKDDYEEVPVVMNTQALTFDKLGVKGMPVFNFVINKAGSYTMSALYLGQEAGPKATLMIIPQTVQNLKQTMVVGIGLFVAFLAGGILILLKMDRWAPKGGQGKS